MKYLLKLILDSIKQGCLYVMSRPLFLVSIVAIPLASAFLMLNLMSDGLANDVPVAIVDLDGSEMSRSIAANIDAMQTTKVVMTCSDFGEARAAMQEGKIMGFFLIPEDFSDEAIAGRNPEMSYYTNYAYIVPASLMYKGFKTVSVLSNGALVKATLTSAGLADGSVSAMLQPVVAHTHAIGNPWTSYPIYMSNSFIPGIIALMAMIVTVFSITDEIKRGTSPQWLDRCGGSIMVALIGRLAPQTLLFTLTGWIIQLVVFGWLDFPLHCNIATMMAAMLLLILACQGMGVLICGIVPNMRIALSICSLLSVLAFSISGITMPVENMYGWVGIISYILPIRYYFLIYIDQALNGIDIYYSRYYFIALLLFVLVSLVPLANLKRMCRRPVYIP